MTKPQNRLLVTPSLLNSWLYIRQVTSVPQDKRKDLPVVYDDLSEEDQEYWGQKLAYDSFLDSLNRVPFEGNKFTEEGIAFENECVEVANIIEKGLNPYNEGIFTDGALKIGKIISGGCFQAVGTKEVTIDGIDFLMYGRLDCLKAGVIYDIKRIWKYERGKFKWSSQHGFYLDLFPNVSHFEFLVWDGWKYHNERYARTDCEPTENIIRDFVRFLKNSKDKNGIILWDIYCDKWIAKDK